MLQLYLHQNFVPFLTEVDQGAEILEGLSFADSQIGGKTGQEVSSSFGLLRLKRSLTSFL